MFSFIILYLTALRQALSGRLVFLARLASKLLESAFPLHGHIQILTWWLGIQTQVFMACTGSTLTTEHSPQHLFQILWTL